MLGKPVIYIIYKQVWDDSDSRRKAVHFDTEHQVIHQWDKDNMDPFIENLKTIIRVNVDGAVMIV